MDGIWWHFAKVLLASLILGFASWLSGKKPELAGFLIALPLSSMLALLFSYSEYRNSEISIRFAQSIFAAIPISLLFFIPFVFADRIKLPYWLVYSSGLVFLVLGYYLHRYILRFFS